MTKSVATHLAIFAGVMFIAFGLQQGLSEHYLAPTGITENAYSAEHVDDGNSAQAPDTTALSCGSAWSPYEEAPDSDDTTANSSKSELSSFGVERCEALLAGTGWTAALLTITGAGILLVLMVGLWERRESARIRWEEQEQARLVEQKRRESDRRRQEISGASD